MKKRLGFILLVCIVIACQSFASFANEKAFSESVYEVLDSLYSKMSPQYQLGKKSGKTVYQQVAVRDLLSDDSYCDFSDTIQPDGYAKCEFGKKIGVYQAMLPTSSDKNTQNLIMVKRGEEVDFLKQERSSVRNIFDCLYETYKENTEEFPFSNFYKCVKKIINDGINEQGKNVRVYSQFGNMKFYFPINKRFIEHKEKLTRIDSVYYALHRSYANYSGERKSYRRNFRNGCSPYDIISIIDLVSDYEYHNSVFSTPTERRLCPFNSKVGVYESYYTCMSHGSTQFVVFKDVNEFRIYENEYMSKLDIIRDLESMRKKYPNIFTEKVLDCFFDSVLYDISYKFRRFIYYRLTSKENFYFGFELSEDYNGLK